MATAAGWASETTASPSSSATPSCRRCTRRARSSGGGRRSVTSAGWTPRAAAVTPQVYPPFAESGGPQKRPPIVTASPVSGNGCEHDLADLGGRLDLSVQVLTVHDQVEH